MDTPFLPPWRVGLRLTLAVLTLSVLVSLEPVLLCTKEPAVPVSTRPREEGSVAPLPWS